MSTPPTSTDAAPPTDDALLAAYVDGELSPEAEAAVEARLRSDPAARAEVDELRKLVAVVSELPQVEPPEDFADRVVRKLRRARATPPESPALGLLVLTFQVLGILVILAVAALTMMAELDDRPIRGPVRETIAPERAPGGPRPPAP